MKPPPITDLNATTEDCLDRLDGEYPWSPGARMRRAYIALRLLHLRRMATTAEARARREGVSARNFERYMGFYFACRNAANRIGRDYAIVTEQAD